MSKLRWVLLLVVPMGCLPDLDRPEPGSDLGVKELSPELPVASVDLAAGERTCKDAADCDDKVACTTDSCSPAGQCSNLLQPAFCLIGGACIAEDAPNPVNACLRCDPPATTSAWSKSGGACVVTIAGSGVPGFADGAALQAMFSRPEAVTVDAAGKVYACDLLNQRIRLLATSAVSTLAGKGPPGDADGAAAQATFNLPAGIAVDSSGAVYIGDSANRRIRRIAGGQVTTFAGKGSAGDDEGAAASAEFRWPTGLALDGAKLYVADRDNDRIRVVAGGQVTRFAGSGHGLKEGAATDAELADPTGVAVDGQGRVYVADSSNHRVRIVQGGQVSTFAGSSLGFADGAATSAKFFTPISVAVDGQGRVYVADRDNHRIRMIVNGQVTTLAGSVPGHQDGLAASARFNLPVGVAVDSQGYVYVADAANHRLRMIVH